MAMVMDRNPKIQILKNIVAQLRDISSKKTKSKTSESTDEPQQDSIPAEESGQDQDPNRHRFVRNGNNS